MNQRLADQRRLINLWILRASIGLSLAAILIGLGVFLVEGADYVPHTPSGSITAIVAYVWQEALGLHASAFLDFGVLVMLFTPLARLVAGVVANVRLRDWLYTSIGLIVTVLVVIGLWAGQGGG